MGVYIEGMKMPINCDNCVLMTVEGEYGEPTCPFGLVIRCASEKHPDCPLVPVPPHGRLIDADALMLKILDYIEEYSDVDEKGWHNLKWCAMKEAEMAINNAPTVIEAEGGE